MYLLHDEQELGDAAALLKESFMKNTSIK
jgi:hypothetical protein